MRLTLDGDMDHAAALIRARSRKVVGRKHNHQPRGRALERQLGSVKRAEKMRNARRKKFSLRVAAYWRGELNGYPA